MKMIDASNIFSSVNSSGARESEASCWRLRRQRPKSAAANMPLWTLFLFKRPHFTKTMDTGRFLRSKNIRTSANGTITQKNYFNFKFYGGKNMKYTGTLIAVKDMEKSKQSITMYWGWRLLRTGL